VVPIQVAVCGPSACTVEQMRDAHRVGELLAERGVTVICGGGPGVMAAVAKGVRERGGVVIGIRPDADKATASPDLSAVIVTNLGEARNAVIVNSADAVIGIGGSWGTLSEIAMAMRRGVPVIDLSGWRILDSQGSAVGGIEAADSAEDAVRRALRDQSGGYDD
jgi:uncharacterized protein (TIGR00725 family)